MATPDFVLHALRSLSAKGLDRHLVEVGSAAGPYVRLGGRTVLQFASNNYLGLAGDPRVRHAAARAVQRWGWGAGASRLLAGHTEAHAALEAELAAFMHAEAAIVFPTGYMTNLGVLTALAGRGDTVVADRANHASLYDGVRLAAAHLVRYGQADGAAARRLLEEHRDRPGRRLVVTDAVFSMDGRTAPLAELALAAGRTGAVLIVDEAHAIGILGPTGAGLTEELGLEQAVTSRVGTLSKALGGVGGFVAASRDVCDLLINRARPFIYTTALPAAACEAARAALAVLRQEPQRRLRLLDLAARLRTMLAEKGFDVPAGRTPIVPIVVGEARRAVEMAGRLLERGIYCPAIRPPTVPPGTSRLRISLTAEHTEEDLERLTSALADVRDATDPPQGRTSD